MRHDFLRAVIGHGHDAAAIGHQRCCFAGERHQGVSADIVRDAERFARCAHKVALKRLARSVSQRVKHQIDVISFVSYAFEKSFDLIVAGNVAGKQRSFLPKFADQFLHVFFQPFALIIKNQARTGGGPRLGDRPGDAALVRHPKDQADFFC